MWPWIASVASVLLGLIAGFGLEEWRAGRERKRTKRAESLRLQTERLRDVRRLVESYIQQCQEWVVAFAGGEDPTAINIGTFQRLSTGFAVKVKYRCGDAELTARLARLNDALTQVVINRATDPMVFIAMTHPAIEAVYARMEELDLPDV